ncbi:MAG: amidohydrolase family protein [Spirochaetaceae bacterium]
MYNLAVRNAEIYLDSKFHKLNIYVNNGIIEKISPENFDAEEIIDAVGKKIIPGIIDPHVHLNLNIGKYISADDFYSGSIAGIYGGVTTIIDFLSPVSKGSDVETALKNRLKEAEKSLIDFSFHTTASNPVNETENITKEAIRLKIPSIKIFTAYSESNRRTYEKEISKLLDYSNKTGTIILIHSEDEDFINSDINLKFEDLKINRPAISETSMIKKLAELNEIHGGTIYCVHTTCGESVQFMKEKHPDLLNRSFFMESCPHYFIFNELTFKQEDGYKYILAPPLRSENQSKLLKNNIDNIFSIGTDHCPFMSDEKNKNLLKDIPFGIGGIEFSFSIMYNLFGEKIINKMTINPAKLFSLFPRKGILAEGSDADFFIFNENKDSEIVENHSRCDYNLYKGKKRKGFVETCIAGGVVVMKDNKIYPRKGQFIKREVTKYD